MQALLKADNRQQIAFYTALAFHVSGLIAIGVFQSSFFADLTPLNLLVCLGLVLYTHELSDRWFWLFAAFAFVVGYGSEYIGVTTGVLFGSYGYGERFGPGPNGVPWMIGVQWLVTMYCIGMLTHALRTYLQGKHPAVSQKLGNWWMVLTMISDGAFLAVVFDWVLEPVAVALQFWTWENGDIPLSNYFTWYGVSFLILTAFHLLPLRKQNQFAIHLFLIQFMFFLLLRMML